MKLLFAALIAGLLFASLNFNGCSLDTRAIDRLQGDIAPQPDILIIGIDDRSLDEMGLYPWPREVHADLISELIQQKPKIVAFDVGFFEGEKEPLQSAIIKAENEGVEIVLAEQISYEGGIRIQEPVVDAKSGYINLILDTDGLIRDIPLGIEGRTPLSLVVAQTLTSVSVPDVASLPIRYLGLPGTIPTYSYVDALAGDVDVANKIVFVGVTAPSFHDDHITPVSLGKAMPGVEIHAQAFQMFRTRDYLTHAQHQEYYLILFALLGGLIIWLTFVVIEKPWLALIGFIVPPIYIYFVVVSFTNGTIYNPVTPLLSYLVGATAAASMWVILQQKEKRYLRGAFEKYVSPDVIKDIIKNPEHLGLGGRRRELTILFSDIRGFTSISEELTPEELVALLNDYLTVMTELVQEHTGLVDKYIGDAIMAFWNAPLEQKNHAALACETALRMMEELRELQKEERFKNLNIGIGLNTGEVVVGNMGSHQRFDYTCMGDDVNLASRLEGITKQYKVDIIVSENTKNAAGDSFNYRCLDKVRVKGKSKPILLFELLREKTQKHKDFEKGLELYFKGKFADAKKILEKVGDAQSKIMLHRMQELNNIAPKDWDGVFTHTTK